VGRVRDKVLLPDIFVLLFAAKGAFPPSDFCNGFTDRLSVTHSQIPKSVTFLPYPTETLSQTKMNSSKVSVTDFSTSSRVLEPILAQEIQTVFVTLLLSDG
jgi:hypothetical protein